MSTARKSFLTPASPTSQSARNRTSLGPLSGLSERLCEGCKVGNWSVYKPANLASRPAKAARAIKAHRLATIQNSVENLPC